VPFLFERHASSRGRTIRALQDQLVDRRREELVNRALSECEHRTQIREFTRCVALNRARDEQSTRVREFATPVPQGRNEAQLTLEAERWVCHAPSTAADEARRTRKKAAAMPDVT
jgi:hypothetical protein